MIVWQHAFIVSSVKEGWTMWIHALSLAYLLMTAGTNSEHAL